MLVDNRHYGFPVIALTDKEAKDMFEELKRFDYSLPELSCNYLNENPKYNTLHIYTIDDRITFTVVTKSGRHSPINAAHQVITALSSKDMQLSCTVSALNALKTMSPMLYRYIHTYRREVECVVS